MTNNQKISFKESRRISTWLDAALKHEKKKYKCVSVTPDYVPEYEMSQGWGYVVAAYSLLEQSLKALLHMRGKPVPMKHSLTILFGLLEDDDKDILREYYSDYKATAGSGLAAFPYMTLDDFLENLDGDPNTRGDDRIGSFDWRYFLIEETRSQTMPTVSIDYLHEIIYGCNQVVASAHENKFDPSKYTNSWRMQRQRDRMVCQHWFTMRLNSGGWNELGDRLEILWGPDYRGRYDWYIFRGKGGQSYFYPLPDDCSLPTVDKRKELEDFDVDEGLKSIGMTIHGDASDRSNSLTTHYLASR